MISKIFVPTITLLKRYFEEQSFHDFVVGTLPDCIKDHLPKRMKFKSIEYKKDHVVDSFFEMVVKKPIVDIEIMKERGAHIETGVFILSLESEENLTHIALPEMEFVFQKLHESYSFISSYMFYIDHSGLKQFVKMFTFETDDEFDEDVLENLQDYTPLFDSYFYKDEIPIIYYPEIAKPMLLQGRL